ncbi:hypothetical protein SAMN02745166_01684 [Prosthecobacter debontii]|uniref:Uncharacterized protein n=1 Tax=Prosthecobacter debontii TaxID=48467 RepID=A0A1T4XL28_9BACT|nr:hypothetical protein [Prosthecobacter debontii]SKA90262.1 hypothetical protein SAMN02745166_01684 [Prosthecobacter debontii]
MPNLDELFEPQGSHFTHPKLRELEALLDASAESECEIERRREGFTFRPSMIYVFTKPGNGSTQVDAFEWHETLNSFLLGRGVRATSQENEGLRFSIILRTDLQRVEVRYGEGYFNALVLEFVEKTFSHIHDIRSILQKVGPGRPYHGRVYSDAANAVHSVFAKVAQMLSTQLKYDPTSGKRILVQAAKYYLDERFSILPGEFLRASGEASKRREVDQRTTSEVVIFDTNAYRQLTYGLGLEESRAKAVLLRNKDRNAGRLVLAHPIVIWELISHLMDVGDPGYHHCLHALVALGEHATSSSRPEGGVNIMADALLTVCRELFGRLPPGYEQGLQNLGSLVTHITRHAPDLSDSVAQANIQNLGRGMLAKEQSWLNGMAAVVEKFEPGAAKAFFGETTDNEALRKVRAYFETPEFFAAWSHYIVASNAVEVGITSIPPDEFQAKAELVRKIFATPFHLMRVLLQKLATPQSVNLASPKNKRWNFVWDSMIAFSIGPGTIEDGSVHLVTGDKEIVVAASSAGFQKQVISLDAYLKTIGIEE